MFNWPRRTAHSGHSICLYKISLIRLSLPPITNTDKTVFFIKEFIHQSIQHSLGQWLLYVLPFNARRSRAIYTRRRVNQYTGNITDHHTQSLHIHSTFIHTVAHTFILTWIHKVSQPSKMPLHHQTFGHKVVLFLLNGRCFYPPSCPLIKASLHGGNGNNYSQPLFFQTILVLC